MYYSWKQTRLDCQLIQTAIQYKPFLNLQQRQLENSQQLSIICSPKLQYKRNFIHLANLGLAYRKHHDEIVRELRSIANVIFLAIGTIGQNKLGVFRKRNCVRLQLYHHIKQHRRMLLFLWRWIGGKLGRGEQIGNILIRLRKDWLLCSQRSL